MTGLIVSFLICISGNSVPFECVDILNQIAEYEEIDENNPYGYTIGIEGFPYDSDANKVANYWYDQSSGDLDMIATFMAEAMFNKDAVGSHGERGICQLYPNKTNNRWIKDERWNDIMFQAEACVDKWLAVPNPSKVWYAWNKRDKYKKQIYYFE